MRQLIETSNASRLKALLVHVMGEEQNEDRPHLRGRSIVWAANYLAYAHQIPHLVFAGHHFWLGEDRPPLALMTAEEAKRDLEAAGISKTLTVLPTYPSANGKTEVQKPVTETSGEVIAFLAYCHSLGISSDEVGSVSSETHVPSISDLYKKRDVQNPKVFSAEDILQYIPGEIGAQAYLAMIEQIRNSDDERSFKRREVLKRLIYWIPFLNGEEKLRGLSDSQRKISAYPQEVLHFQT